MSTPAAAAKEQGTRSRSAVIIAEIGLICGTLAGAVLAAIDLFATTSDTTYTSPMDYVFTADGSARCSRSPGSIRFSALGTVWPAGSASPSWPSAGSASCRR
jgi:hypothetical protein